MQMDSYLVNYGFQVPPLIQVYNYDIPSFEEAFDTDLLRKFYKCQNYPTTYSKYSQSLAKEEANIPESPPTASTIHANGFLDVFPAKDGIEGNSFSQFDSSPTNSLSNFGISTNQDHLKRANTIIRPSKKNKPFVWGEESIQDSILRKLISKKNVFIIQRDDTKPSSQKIKKKLAGEGKARSRKGSAVTSVNEGSIDGNFVVDSGSNPQKAKGEKKEKKNKKEDKKILQVGHQVNIQIGGIEKSKTEGSANSRKVVFGNLTVGVKSLVPQQAKQSS